MQQRRTKLRDSVTVKCIALKKFIEVKEFSLKHIHTSKYKTTNKLPEIDGFAARNDLVDASHKYKRDCSE